MGTKVEKQRHVICMVSDFFYPNVGGVEEHIFQLSQCLLQRGHKVIILTHTYGDRRQIRYMTNGLKVYYLPIQPFYNQSVLPTFLTSIPLYRNIFLREQVTIVHGHSAFSTMAHEAMNLANGLGLKNVFTDHSLFGFADISAIVTNNFLAVSLAEVNHCICVSYIGKDNTVLRANMDKDKVSVIPNGLDTKHFKPDPSQRPQNKINVIVMCRLQYRKGIDLLPKIIMSICGKYSQVNFIIGGDGPKRSLLEEVQDKVGNDRLQLLGAVPHAKVHGVLVKGHIFLNTSLTEAFCIAICEAAFTGLQVVSTHVGGIHEVLPPELIKLAQPDVDSLTKRLEEAIEEELAGVVIDRDQICEEMRSTYSWQNIAKRTESVYDKVSLEDNNADICLRIPRYKKCGKLAGSFMMFLVTLQFLFLKICDYLWPAKNIDIARDWPSDRNHISTEDSDEAESS